MMHITITRSMIESLAPMGPKTSVTVPVDDDILEDVLTRVLQLQEEVDGRLEKLEDAALVYRSRIDKLETRLEALENAHDEAVSKGERVSVEIWSGLEALDDATAGLKEEKKLKAKAEFLRNRITQDTKQLNSVAGQLRERGHAPRDDAKTPKDVYGRVWS